MFFIDFEELGEDSVTVQAADLEMAIKAAARLARYNGMSTIRDEDENFVMMIWSGVTHSPHRPGAALMLQLHENEVFGIEGLFRDRHRVTTVREITDLYIAYATAT